MVFAQQGDTDRARTHLQKALQLRPEYPDALNNLGVLYLRVGNVSEALAAFRECIRISPGFDQPYLNLARLYAAKAEREEARQVLQQLLDRHPEHQVARETLEQLKP
jgi:Flp pilus assembly protein TadD